MSLNSDGTGTMRALKALVALAELELGEAALTLADRLDEQTAAKQETERKQDVMGQLGQVHERLSQPGMPVNSAAMSVLARQTMAGKAALARARQQQDEAGHLVDAQRLQVHQHQCRHDGLKDGLREAVRAHALARENKAGSDNEDLFLARRQYLETQA